MNADSIHNSILCTKGFSLLEMLIALSLVSIMTVIVASALHLGSRVWNRSEALIETQHRSRILLDRMQRQLRAANYESTLSADFSELTFDGQIRSIAFLSTIALDPAKSFGWVYVRYMVDTKPDGTKRLLVWEQNTALMEPKSVRRIPALADPINLADGFGDLYFEYLDATVKNALIKWLPSWHPNRKQKLPLAVRVTYRENGGAPVRAIAHITASR